MEHQGICGILYTSISFRRGPNPGRNQRGRMPIEEANPSTITTAQERSIMQGQAHFGGWGPEKCWWRVDIMQPYVWKWSRDLVLWTNHHTGRQPLIERYRHGWRGSHSYVPWLRSGPRLQHHALTYWMLQGSVYGCIMQATRERRANILCLDQLSMLAPCSRYWSTRPCTKILLAP